MPHVPPIFENVINVARLTCTGELGNISRELEDSLAVLVDAVQDLQTAVLNIPPIAPCQHQEPSSQQVDAREKQDKMGSWREQWPNLVLISLSQMVRNDDITYRAVKHSFCKKWPVSLFQQLKNEIQNYLTVIIYF